MRKTLLLLILTLFSFSAIHADDNGSCGDNLTWKFTSSDGTLTISGTGDMTDYKSAFDVPWYSRREEIKKVVIADGVTNIGNFAFSSCKALTSITFKGSTPPTFGNDVFDSVDKSIPVYVPAHRGETYKNALAGYDLN